MEKIRILRIIARLNIGGPAINAILLTDGLGKDRFNSRLIVGRIDKDEGDMSYLAQEKNIQPVVIPQLGRNINLFSDIAAFYKIYKQINEYRPDIVHTHTAKAGTLGRLSAALFNLTHRKKIKTVHTFHGHVLSGYFSRVSTIFFIWVERILARFTDLIIVVSEGVKQDILSLGISDQAKIKVVHLGFELDKFLVIKPREANQELNIGIVGRLVPIKNHEMFFDAARLFLNSIPNTPCSIQFFIIGDGELRPQLESYAKKLGIADKVEFSGWQSDLAAVYENLDIIALTSLNEGTPVSIIEALASARAVIASDVGGVKDLLSTYDLRVTSYEICERGVLVKSQDTESFTQGLIALAKDIKLRKKMAEDGREFVRERFDKKRLIKDMEMLYNILLN